MSTWTSSPAWRRSYRFGGSGGSDRDRFPSPIRFSHNDTVEGAKPSTSAISAAVIRNPRSAWIARTRCGATRIGLRRGRDERSNKTRSLAR
jgi:hypothetical protein